MEQIHIDDFWAQGPVDTLQDRYLYGSTNDNRALVLGVADGHGEQGDLAAELACNVVNQAINLYRAPDDQRFLMHYVDELIKNATEFLKRPGNEYGLRSGASATICVIENGVISIANVGRNRTRLYPGKDPFIDLSERHDLTNQDERVRACDEGGFIVCSRTESGEYIESLTDEDRLLRTKVTRAIGNLILPCVSGKPSYHHYRYAQGKLVVGTYGFWGAYTPSYINQSIRAGALTTEHVEERAEVNRANATALVATLG